jgi:hypothetical protein
VVEVSTLGTWGLVSVGLSILGGVLIGVVVAWVSVATRLRRFGVVALVWLGLFLLQFSNLVEGVFFTTVYSNPVVLGGSLLRLVLGALVQGVMAGALFLPTDQSASMFSELSNFFKHRLFRSWVWRVAAASAAYLPVYFFFGALISPFILPYYTDPSLGLRIPSFTVILPLELFRGLLYVLLLTPILASVRSDRRTVWGMVASVLYIPGALVPILTQSSLPPAILPFHLAEILADSLVYGAVITFLLAKKTSNQ